jgi:hypothetical protein
MKKYRLLVRGMYIYDFDDEATARNVMTRLRVAGCLTAIVKEREVEVKQIPARGEWEYPQTVEQKKQSPKKDFIQKVKEWIKK